MATVETLLNPAKSTEELTSELRDYKLPGIDVDAVVASRRKNVEALVNANRAAFEGTQAVARRLGDTPVRKGGEMHLFTFGNTYRAAEKLFGTHGEGAQLEAAHLAEQHFSKIDLGGYARWKAVERVLTLRAA